MRKGTYTAALLLVLALAGPAKGSAFDEAVPYWVAKHCRAGHPSTEGYKSATRLLKNHRPLTPKTKRAVRQTWLCTTTQAKARAVLRHIKRLRSWRESYPHRWPIAFNRLPSSDRAWAISTSTCESGMNPATNTGNGFYGAFQFVLSTWYAAGGRGMPNQHSWHYQAVIAIGLMEREGAGHWPNCG